MRVYYMFTTVHSSNVAIWACAWDFQQCGMCDQQSPRSACTYAQSDQSLFRSLEYFMTAKLLTEHHLEFLSFKGGCTGSYESTLVKMPHCCKWHVAAHRFVCYFRHYTMAMSSSGMIPQCWWWRLLFKTMKIGKPREWWEWKHLIVYLKRLSLQLWTFFEKIYFLFKSFVKVELSYVFTINLFTITENCMEKWIIL